MGKKNLVTLHSIEVSATPEEIAENNKKLEKLLVDIIYDYIKKNNLI